MDDRHLKKNCISTNKQVIKFITYPKMFKARKKIKGMNGNYFKKFNSKMTLI